MGGLSAFHWLVVAVVVLLLFGNRLPQVMRSLGQGVVEFKKGLAGIEDEMHKANTKVDEQTSSKPQAKEEAKVNEVEAAQR